MAISVVKVIGVVRMSGSREKDGKIIAVPANDPRFEDWNSAYDIINKAVKMYKEKFE